MKKLFNKRSQAKTIHDALRDLGYWVNMRCKRLPDDTGWQWYIEIFGYDN